MFTKIHELMALVDALEHQIAGSRAAAALRTECGFAVMPKNRSGQ
jgi:hypothetical protein